MFFIKFKVLPKLSFFVISKNCECLPLSSFSNFWTESPAKRIGASKKAQEQKNIKSNAAAEILYIAYPSLKKFYSSLKQIPVLPQKTGIRTAVTVYKNVFILSGTFVVLAAFC